MSSTCIGLSPTNIKQVGLWKVFRLSDMMMVVYTLYVSYRVLYGDFLGYARQKKQVSATWIQCRHLVQEQHFKRRNVKVPANNKYTPRTSLTHNLAWLLRNHRSLSNNPWPSCPVMYPRWADKVHPRQLFNTVLHLILCLNIIFSKRRKWN